MMPHMKLMTYTSRVVSDVGAWSVLVNQITGIGPHTHHARTMSSICDKYRSSCGGDNKSNKSITMETINRNIVELQYAVRGPIPLRAMAIEKELEKGAEKPFKHVIKANIGDAHAMGQKPITFFRQVLACAADTTLIEKSDYPDDVKQRACELVQCCGGCSVGSYTVSYGIEKIRKQVAAFIEQRDGFKCDYNNVCLTAGATPGIKHVLQLYAHDYGEKKSSVMISTPRYPLYSAVLAEFGLGQTPYFLDEEKNWALSLSELERAYDEGSQTQNVRVIVVINPGNPTGQVLTRENIMDVIKFAHARNMLIIADEVYQHNVYARGSKFYSFKKVMMEMGDPYDKLELVSFMSISKCYIGECGLRGGWMEICNMDPEVQAQLYKAISAMLCSSSLGQIVIHCVAKPPQQGEPSYELFCQERKQVLDSLAQRAAMTADTFNKMDGFKCNTVQGAMYAFPQLNLPPKAIEAAQAAGQAPDVFYAFRLLEETGICVIPGAGFGQKPGTYHFRTTILPQPPLLKEMLEIFQKFHAKFTSDFS